MNEKERESFLRARTSVGASEVAAVMGLSQYRGPAEVYTRLVMLHDHGEIDGADPANDDILRGVLLESVAVKYFEDTRGVKTRRVTSADEVEGKPYLRSNPDRIILGDGVDSTTKLLEIKVPRPSTIRRWKEEGMRTDSLVQVYAQLMCRPRVNSAIVFAFDPVTPSESFEVEIDRDPEYEAKIDQALQHFWNQHFLPRRMPKVLPDYDPPPLVTREVAFPEDEAVVTAMRNYAAFSDVESEAKAEKKKYRAIIEQAAASLQSKRLKADDVQATVTWAAGRDRIDFNRLKLFLLEHGASLDDFHMPGAPYTIVRSRLLGEEKKG